MGKDRSWRHLVFFFNNAAVIASFRTGRPVATARNLSESICNFQAEVFAAPRQPHLSTGTVEALDAGVDPASAALSPKSVIRSIASGLVYASVVLFQTLYHLEPAYRRLCMHFTFAF